MDCVPDAVPLVESVIELASAGGVTAPEYVKLPANEIVLKGPEPPLIAQLSKIKFPVIVVVPPGKVLVPVPVS